MPHLLSLLLFAVFLALGLRLRWATAERSRQRATRALIGYTVGVSLAVAVSQRDAWPFTSYTLAGFPAQVDRTICRTEFVGVDDAGEEGRVDPYSWSPVYDSILQYWFEQEYRRLSEGEKADTLRFLLDRAEAGRRRRAAGRELGFARRLGSLHARYWWMLRRPAVVSEGPYRALRVYAVCWVPRERFLDPSRETRRLVTESRP